MSFRVEGVSDTDFLWFIATADQERQTLEAAEALQALEEESRQASIVRVRPLRRRVTSLFSSTVMTIPGPFHSILDTAQ